jgi:hypothetical protein
MVLKVVCRDCPPWFLLLALQALFLGLSLSRCIRNGRLHRINAANAASLARLRRWDSWGMCGGWILVGAFDGIASRKLPSWRQCGSWLAQALGLHPCSCGPGRHTHLVDPAHVIGFPDQVPQRSDHGPPQEVPIQFWRVDFPPVTSPHFE